MTRKNNSVITAILAGWNLSKRHSLLTTSGWVSLDVLHEPDWLPKQAVLITARIQLLWFHYQCYHHIHSDKVTELARELLFSPQHLDHPHSYTNPQAAFKAKFFSLAGKRTPNKLSEVKSYPPYTSQKTHSIITVLSRPMSQSSSQTATAPYHAALLHSAETEQGKKHIMGQGFQFSMLHNNY